MTMELAPYVGTPPLTRNVMLWLAHPQYGERLVDAGSGKGNIVISAAKKCLGLKCIGYEIDPDLVKESRRRIAAKGLEDRIEIVQGDVFDYNLGEANILAAYLSPQGMEEIEDKILTELGENARIVLHDYGFRKVAPNVLISLFDIVISPRWRLRLYPFKIHWAELYRMNDLIEREVPLKEILQFWNKRRRFNLYEFRAKNSPKKS
jgi:ubiquinone/menaquinone biosynthesis C-methylase UbiE